MSLSCIGSSSRRVARFELLTCLSSSPQTQHNTGSTPVGSQGFGELEAGDPSPKVLVEDVSSSGGVRTGSVSQAVRTLLIHRPSLFLINVIYTNRDPSDEGCVPASVTMDSQLTALHLPLLAVKQRRPRSRAPRPTIPIKCSHLGCEPLSFKRPCDLKLHMVRHSSPTGEFDCQTCGHRCKS